MLSGQGQAPGVAVLGTGDCAIESRGVGEISDFTASNLIRFPATNPNSPITKHFMVHNDT